MPSLDAERHYTIAARAADGVTYAEATTLRAALTYAVDQREGRGARVHILDDHGREFGDLHIWQEFVTKWHEEHSDAPVHFVRPPHPNWLDTRDMFNETLARVISEW